MDKKLDYTKLWRTLMKTGINQRFSQIRSEFFMKLATDGPRVYQGQKEQDKIIEESEVLTKFEFFQNLLKQAISPEDQFKHYSYVDGSGFFYVEYFANVTSGIRKEFVDFAFSDDSALKKDYNIDGYCHSILTSKYTNSTLAQESNDDLGEDEDPTERGEQKVTVHFILIGEGESITPDTYPSVIKHELTHACLFELRILIDDGYYDRSRVPVTWTDEEMFRWHDDLQELREVLASKEPECRAFNEFASEFLMYESDGQTKERNPIVESRVPRTTKSDAKPKVTYRTLTPLDRFEEFLEDNNKYYADMFADILADLRPVYDKYDEFLDSIKMQ